MPIDSTMLVDQNTFKLLKNAIKKDGSLELPSSGNSMFPFIQPGNICRFVYCEPAFLKKGDVILYCSEEGQLIAHRLIEKANQPTYLFFLKGDSNLGMDKPITKEQIIGKLVLVKKQRINIGPGQIMPKLWGNMILSFPMLSGILRRYLNRNLQF